MSRRKTGPPRRDDPAKPEALLLLDGCTVLRSLGLYHRAKACSKWAEWPCEWAHRASCTSAGKSSRPRVGLAEQS